MLCVSGPYVLCRKVPQIIDLRFAAMVITIKQLLLIFHYIFPEAFVFVYESGV